MSKYFHSARLLEIRDEAPDAYTLVLENPAPELFSYQAGQYLTLRLDIGGESLRRAYSLSSAPLLDPHLSVTIKRTPGGKVSNYLRDHLKAGDTLELMPPMGHFSLSPDMTRSRHYILIGAGSGITPLFSILRTALHAEPLSKVTLWYGSRDEASIIFREALAELGRQYGERLHVQHSLSQPSPAWKGFSGRLDKQRIYDWISELFLEDEYRKQYYVCGPLPMMEAALAALDKHAVDPQDVFREYYSAPVPTEEEVASVYAAPAPEGQPAAAAPEQVGEYPLLPREVTVILDGQAKRVAVKPTEYILDGAIRARLDVPYACQSGICTTCRAMLHKGVVSMDETEGLSKSELEAGYILTCQAHPLTEDVELEYM